MSLKLTSPAFELGGVIPARYTCDGEDISPPLVIAGVPEAAQSLVLLVDDPDVPRSVREDGLWVHWVMWNIDPEIAGIDEDSVPPGAVQGTTTAGVTKYGGPCPPDREHRYFFKLYALDTTLALPETAIEIDLEQAMEGHVIGLAELMGRYDRKR